jgi:hypothetical protein
MLADLLVGFVLGVSTSWRVCFQSAGKEKEKFLERLEPVEQHVNGQLLSIQSWGLQSRKL